MGDILWEAILTLKMAAAIIKLYNVILDETMALIYFRLMEVEIAINFVYPMGRKSCYGGFDV